MNPATNIIMEKQKIKQRNKSKKEITEEKLADLIRQKPIIKTKIFIKEIKKPELKEKIKKDEAQLEKENKMRRFQEEIRLKKFSSFPMEKEIVDERFVEFLQPSSKVPVLEKITRNDDINLEEQLGNVVFKPQEKENRGNINYAETKSNYLSATNPNGDSDVKYVQSSDYVTMLQDSKESRETRNIMRNTGEKIVGEKRGNRWENIERETFVDENNNTKKYLARGDYRQN